MYFLNVQPSIHPSTPKNKSMIELLLKNLLVNTKVKAWRITEFTRLFLFSREWSHAGLVKFKNGPEVVMVAAGDHTNTVEIFNLGTWEWSYHTSWTEYRAGGMSVPYGDTFLVVGGEISSGDYSTEILWFNLDTEAWETRPEVVPSQTAYSAAFFVPNSYIRCT